MSGRESLTRAAKRAESERTEMTVYRDENDVVRQVHFLDGKRDQAVTILSERMGTAKVRCLNAILSGLRYTETTLERVVFRDRLYASPVMEELVV